MSVSLFSFEIHVDSALNAQLAAAVVGILVTVAWRIIDRYLPDPNRPSPAGSTATPPSPARSKE